MERAATEEPDRFGRGRILPIFARFLVFGIRAFGGPVVQIAELRAEFIDRLGWTTRERFDRALGVYQLLPGPEAHEMCCYLGTVRGGRLGGIAAGFGFMLPGLVLMLVASALYGVLDLGSPPVAGAMAAMQIAACALILRAVWKLARPLCRDWRIAVAVAAACVSLAMLAAHTTAPTAASAMHEGPRTATELFGHGLTAGLVTFGGAYTALPYVTSVAAGAEGWMTNDACLDGIAIASVLPAPLVIFGTFVGFLGGGLAGALAFTAGIFLPAFGFTFVGFGLFERLVAWRPARITLDILGAAAVGLIAGAAAGFVLDTSHGTAAHPAHFGLATPALIAVALVALMLCRTRLAAPLLVGTAAAAGALHGAFA